MNGEIPRDPSEPVPERMIPIPFSPASSASELKKMSMGSSMCWLSVFSVKNSLPPFTVMKDLGGIR